MLTQQRLKELLHYNQDTGLFTRLTNRGGRLIGSIAGTHDSHGHIQIRIDGKLYLAHRLVWLYMHGYFPINQIDHKDGVRDSNKYSNLREATNKQNCENQLKPRVNNSSGYLGVSFYKPLSMFKAQICDNYITRHIGYYLTPLEAHNAYLEEKRKIHYFNTL